MRFTRRDMMMIEYLRDYEVLELDSMSEYLGVSVKTLKNQLKEVGGNAERIRSGYPSLFPSNQLTGTGDMRSLRK